MVVLFDITFYEKKIPRLKIAAPYFGIHITSLAIFGRKTTRAACKPPLRNFNPIIL